MQIHKKLRRILFSSGLSKEEYKLIEDRVAHDNRRKLSTGTMIVTIALLVMFVLSLLIDSMAHSRNIYFVSVLVTVFIHCFALFGKKSKALTTIGIYLFTDLALIFGIYQGVITSPQEQTASYLALVLAIPFWFGMIPIRMIASIFVFTGIFVAGAIQFKTGDVRTADIVNSIVYTGASAIISTYATCSKCKRFYAEYLTEQAGKTDPLTSLGNRFAFSEHIKQFTGVDNLPDNLTVWYFDVNELKLNNDTYGHQVGDELLCGAAECIVSTLGDVGMCYRTGGDEFVVIGKTDHSSRKKLCNEFDRMAEAWRTPSGKPLRISYGCASSYELPDRDIQSIISLADSRLYEAKDEYYRTQGTGRRGHEPAISKLSDSCIIIIKVDLTNNTFRRLRNDIHDELDPYLFVEGFSQCMEDIASSERIHPDDLKRYNEKTQLEYLRNYFRSGKRSLHIFYKRRIEEEYYPAMTEFIAANEYTDEQQIVYLYVKIINE